MKRTFKKQNISFIFLALLLGLLAFLLASLWAIRTNTLLAHNKWQSEKTQLEMAVQGAFSFMYFRSSLALNKLHLGDWSSNQRVFANIPPIQNENTLSVSFNLELPSHSYLTFLFAQHHDRFEGITISFDSQLEDLHFVAKPTGEFSWSSPLPKHRKDYLDWDSFSTTSHFITIELGPEKLRFWANGVFRFEVPIQSKGSLLPIGFMGGPGTGVYIDNVVVKDGERLLFADSFDSWETLGPKFVLCFLCLGFLVWALFTLLKKKFSSYHSQFHLITCLLTCSFALAIFIPYDFFVLSSLHPSGETIDSQDFVNKIEDHHQVIQRLSHERSPQSLEDHYTILFLGSSQTWGAGALKRSESVGEVLRAKIESEFKCVRFIPAGVSGATIKSLTAHYQSFFHLYSPDLILVSLIFNDLPNVDYGLDMEELISTLKKTGDPEILLIQEPAADDVHLKLRYTRRTKDMAEVAKKNQLPLLLTQDKLLQKSSKGFLWWDNIHLTSFGQKVLAEIIYKDLRSRLYSANVCSN